MELPVGRISFGNNKLIFNEPIRTSKTTNATITRDGENKDAFLAFYGDKSILIILNKEKTSVEINGINFDKNGLSKLIRDLNSFLEEMVNE